MKITIQVGTTISRKIKLPFKKDEFNTTYHHLEFNATESFCSANVALQNADR